MAISTQVLVRRLREADAVSFALMAPCACRQARYASRCVAEADLEEDAGLQQRCAAALRGGALPFPEKAWALAASDAAPPASYVAAVPRGAPRARAAPRGAPRGRRRGVVRGDCVRIDRRGRRRGRRVSP